MKSVFIWVGITVSVVAIVLFAMFRGYEMGKESAYVPSPPFTYPEARAGFSDRRAKLFGQADTLIIGDSLIEQNFLDGVCGRTFSAGLGGARVAEPLSILPSLLENLDPDRVFIAIGTNYFSSAVDEYQMLKEDYPQLVDAVGNQEIILVGIANDERGNEYIRNVAQERQLQFLDPPQGPMLPDGLHYNEAGSRAYRQMIEGACSNP